MDFGFDVISAEEYERQHALYGPLTEALRKLVAAGIHTEADADTVRDAQSAIEAATEMLERKPAQRDVDPAS
jgi:3-hydroxyacyl-CoA dehydrogenase